MAKSRKKTAKDKRTKRSFGAGISWRIDNLSATQSADLDERYPDDDTLLEFITQAIDAGLDVKISHDPYNDAYQASCIGAWEGFENAGYGCSGFSRQSGRDALAVVWYKISIVADGRLDQILSISEAEDLRG